MTKKSAQAAANELGKNNETDEVDVDNSTASSDSKGNGETMAKVQQVQISKEEEAAWDDTVALLIAQGVKPEDVQNVVMEQQPHVQGRRGAGLMAAARYTLSQPITWADVLVAGLAVVGFIGLLKLIGMAFNVSIPLLHKATVVAPTPALPA